MYRYVGNLATSDRQALCQRHLVIQNQILGPIWVFFGAGFCRPIPLKIECVERVCAVNGLVFFIDFDRRKMPEKNENAYEQIIV